MKKIIFLLILFSLNTIACESLKDDGLNDSLLFKDHGCLKLTADTEDFRQYSFTNPSFNLLAYQNILIEDVIINQQPDDSVTQSVLDDMKRAIKNSIIEHIGDHRQIVSDPGPYTARLEVSFSGARVSGEGIGILDLLPVKALWNLGKKAADKNTKVPIMIVESKLTDTQDNSLQRARVILVRGESFVDRDVTRDNFVGMADMTVEKAFESY